MIAVYGNQSIPLGALFSKISQGREFSRQLTVNSIVSVLATVLELREGLE
ncbi:hypothetical protein [Desulfosporosinus fructosivorans]